jgi:hypothetical protein
MLWIDMSGEYECRGKYDTALSIPPRSASHRAEHNHETDGENEAATPSLVSSSESEQDQQLVSPRAGVSPITPFSHDKERGRERDVVVLSPSVSVSTSVLASSMLSSPALDGGLMCSDCRLVNVNEAKDRKAGSSVPQYLGQTRRDAAEYRGATSSVSR